MKTIDIINKERKALHEECPIKQPIDYVMWVPIEKVEPNGYNPNSVAPVEMELLYKSIKKMDILSQLSLFMTKKKINTLSLIDSTGTMFVKQKRIYLTETWGCCQL